MPTSTSRSLVLGAWLLIFGMGLTVVPSVMYGQGETPAKKKTTTPARPPASKSAVPATEKKAPPAAAPANEDAVADADAEEKKDRVAAERFLSVLEKNPRRGTALDKVYGFHVERGSLDTWLKQYHDRTAKQDQDGTAWMLLGLIEAHRGQDAAAVKALQKAEQFLPENPLASFYLGQSLVLVGQPDLAAAAFERAIERKPAQADLLEVFQALGRVYQRGQKSDKALEVWNRLENLFPNDLRVQEQIAQTLVEEGQAALALPRFEALAAKTTKDLYRQSQFRIQVAEIKVRLGKAKEALVDFEKLLGQLNPENWLYRDVRHKIDEVFLRTDDQAGLATYYEGWVEKHPEDVDAMARLARILATQGRAPEAQKWLEKGLKLAPSRKELRMTIIDQLIYDQKYAEAIQQYELLDQREPNNPDTIRDWGRLILKDTNRKEEDRKQAATALWKRLVAAKPQDPLIATQVADLFRHAEMSDEALALYKKAIELDPNSPQYREYLGEYYHQLKKPEEALATWRQIVDGKNRTAPNLARLAEVLMGFGYLAEGTVALADAVKLEPQDFDLRLRLGRALNRGEKYDESLQHLATANTLVTNAEESEAVLHLQLQNYQAAEKLPTQIEALEKELAQAKAEPKLATNWYLLARYYEADRKLPDALKSIQKSLELDPQSIPSLAATARIQEANNSLLDAAETNRKLAAVDRRFRTEYMTNVAKLEARLGRRAEALQAGRDVIASAPGNPDSYEFFAQLCFQLGENNEGLETLRRSVRVNPSDPKVVLGLASALAEQFKTAEAIELYWRAFEKNTEIDGKLDVITKLTELYLQTNHLDRLLERLERERREDSQQQRIMTLCIAQAHQAAGDFGTARSELERMLAPDTRDTPLLQQLAKLAEAEGDFISAIKYQQQLNKLAPSKEHDLQLAHYLSQSGENEQAGQLMIKVALDEKDPDKLLKSLDSLLQRDQTEQALLITERLLRDQPRNWEYLYRDGVALFAKQPDKAEERFKQILALNLPDDEPGVAEKARLKLAAGQRPNQSSASRAAQNAASPLMYRYSARTQGMQMLRYSTGLDARYRYSSNTFWTPTNYGNARMGAFAWLQSAAQKKGQQDAFLKAQKATWEQAKTSPRAAWDWYYIQSLQQNPAELHEATKALIRTQANSPDAQFLYLITLSSRNIRNQNQVRRATNETPQDATPPLPDDELQLVLETYKRTLDDPAFESLSQSYYGANLASTVETELIRAKREPEARKLNEEAVARAKTPDQISNFMNKAAGDGNTEQVLKLWDALDKLPANTAGGPPQQYLASLAQQAIPRLMAHRAEAKEFSDVLKLLDRYLTSDLARRRAEAGSAKTQNKSFGNPYGTNQRSYYQIWISKNNTDQVVLDFPQPNAHFDYSAIMLLRNAFAQYQQADLTSDLVKHFETRANHAETPVADRLPWQLGAAYLHWWTDSQDVALKELQAISKALPDDPNFKLELADLYGTRNDFAEALEILNSITPLDQDVMQRRETQALRVAIQLGETERAREAAARLFGLRLDAETQVQLASQMKQLGMHEQAEAVMARAGRQAGNRMGALLTLMREFQAQGKTDTALQIAQTILRRTQSRGAASSRNSGNDANSSYRQQAVQFLVDSGKLKDLIERAESQLKNSPKSIQLHQTLSEYYTAAGNKEKAKEFALKLAELNANDPLARWNIARQLLQAGEVDAAVDHLKAALKQQPRLFANEYWEVQNAFRRAKKTGDLVKILEEIDLKQLGQSYVVSNIIQELMGEETSRKSALVLLKRAWDAFPDERTNLLSSIYDEEVWKTPELYEYARQAFVPQEGQGFVDPWAGFNIRSYSGDGTVRGSLHHLLVAAKAQNKTAALEQEINAALAKSPTWHGGKAMLAIIQTQRGEHEAALKAFQEILSNKDQALTGQAAWLIGQELKAIPKTDELAIQFYEFANADPSNGINNQFQYSPGSALVAVYEKSGQKDKAREMLLKAVNKKVDTRYDAQYQAYQRIQSQYEIAERLRKMGFGIDSIKIYNRILLDRNSLELANNYGGREYAAQSKKGLETALGAIDKSQLTTGVQALLQPGEGADKDPQAPAIDLFLTLAATDGKPERVISLLANILDKVAQQPELQAEVTTSLQKLQTERPDDVSVRVLTTIFAARNPQPEVLAKAAEEIDQWVTAHPLEALTDGKRSNARQRETAARQLSLWLVVRECLSKEPLRPIGLRLAAHVLEAARRQPENNYLLAMVRESGQLAWDAGDTATAEARWSEMLDLILIRPGVGTTPNMTSRPAPPGAPTPAAVAVPKPPPSTATGRKAPPGLPSTLAQFKQALDIAKQVEEKKLHALSLKAMRTVFKGGPPVEVDPNAAQRSGRVIIRSSSNGESNNVETTVANGLWDMHKLWNKSGAPADQVYDVLASIVMPESRPDELLLYARPLPAGDNPEARSAGLLLARQAILANKVDALREQVEQLAKAPKAEFNGQLLLAMLALETKDLPRAKAALQEVSKMVDRYQNQTAAELICHVTLAAMDNTELAESAQPLLLRSVKHLSTANNRNNSQRISAMLLKLARVEFKKGQNDSGRQLLNDYLKGQDALYQDYGGDYGSYMRKRTLQTLASEYAKAGLLEDALEKLGEAADMPKFENYGDADDGTSMVAVLKQLRTKSPEEQYAILKTWTLPTAGRKTIRMMARFGPADSAPEAFVKGLLTITGNGKTGKQGLESSAKLLVEAAGKAKKLDELEGEVKPLAEQKVDRARELLALIHLAQKKAKEAEPDVKLMLNELREKAPVTSRTDFPWHSYLVTREALTDPDLKTQGQELARLFIQHTQQTQNHQVLADVRYQLAQSLVSNFPGAQHAGGADPHLKWWQPGTEVTAYQHAAGQAAPWWVAHDGIVSQICGPDRQFLYFRYPLTGTFEFQVDAYCGGWAEGSVGYAGLWLIGAMNGSQTDIAPHGYSETLFLPAGPRLQSQFNRHTIQVQPDKMRYLVNNTLLYEDKDPSHNGPWLALYCGRPQHAAYRNFQITGQPTIPREVRLMETDRLEGWVANFFNESQPPRRTIGKPSPNDSNEAVTRNPNVNAYDWAAKEGVIHGRKLDGLNSELRAQSWLYYHRPLDAGDTLSYEFFYEPDKTHVHPTLDRLTFLLAPEGVRLHWITDGSASPTSELGPDNVIDLPDDRRGPANLPLLPGQWNTLRVALQNPTVRLELNGQLIYESQLDNANNRQFGLFHDKTKTAVQVRNVVLTGHWPEQLSPEILADLIAPDETPLTSADRRARHAIIGEHFYVLGARDILRKAQSLSEAERYALLKNWVLPNADHPTYRLVGDLTPVDQPPVGKLSAAATDSTALPQKAQHTGGDLRAPALELIATAKALNHLPELKHEIEILPSQSPNDKRCKFAMLALLNMSQGKWNVADALLTSLFEAQRQLGPDASAADRWPDLLAAVEAARHPETRFESNRLFEEAVSQIIRKAPDDDFDHLVRALRDDARWLAEQEAWKESQINYPVPRQWIPSSAVAARFRGLGVSPGRWLASPGELRHFSGRTEDLIYFQSPLRGDFEVNCELSFVGWRELDVLYGGQYNSLLYTLNEVRLGRIAGQLPNGQLEQAVKPVGYVYDYKLTVKDGVASAFVDGQRILERRLPTDFDPWLGIHAPSRNAGIVRNIRITGSPTIPQELDLLALDHLGEAWRGDYYNQNEMVWKKEADELRSEKVPDIAGRKLQTLAQYHRPLAEDAELDYEFFFEPGAVGVHPALDRLVMLVEPDGVNLHWLTDSQYDVTGLDAGNVTSDKEHRRGPEKLPLKIRDWNQARLKLVGQTVSLLVNGVEVYQRELDPTNQRTFGLFHFADETQARVRNIRYRGNWPTMLPPLAQQEMAVSPTTRATFAKSDLPHETTWNAKRPATATPAFQIVGDAPFVTVTPAGLKAALPAGREKPDGVGVRLTTAINGDFEVTGTFSGLKSTRPDKDPTPHGPGLDLNVFVVGPEQNWVKLERRVYPDQRPYLQSVHGQVASGNRQSWHIPHFTYSGEGQRLKLVRKGAFAYFLIAPHDSDDFRLIDQRVVGKQPAMIAELLVRAFGKDQGSEAILESLTIRTQHPLDAK